MALDAGAHEGAAEAGPATIAQAKTASARAFNKRDCIVSVHLLDVGEPPGTP